MLLPSTLDEGLKFLSVATAELRAALLVLAKKEGEAADRDKTAKIRRDLLKN